MEQGLRPANLFNLLEEFEDDIFELCLVLALRIAREAPDDACQLLGGLRAYLDFDAYHGRLQSAAPYMPSGCADGHNRFRTDGFLTSARDLPRSGSLSARETDKSIIRFVTSRMPDGAAAW